MAVGDGINILSTISGFLPVLAALINYKNLDKALKIVAVYCLVSDALVVGLLLYGLMLALRRTSLPAPSRMRIGVGITVVLLAWNGLAFFLATHGVFEAKRVPFRLRHIAPGRIPAKHAPETQATTAPLMFTLP